MFMTLLTSAIAEIQAAYQTVEKVINICGYNNIYDLIDVSHRNEYNDKHNGSLNNNTTEIVEMIKVYLNYEKCSPILI